MEKMYQPNFNFNQHSTQDYHYVGSEKSRRKSPISASEEGCPEELT